MNLEPVHASFGNILKIGKFDKQYVKKLRNVLFLFFKLSSDYFPFLGTGGLSEGVLPGVSLLSRCR
jgi:hypothetical protein